jgi:hypothetical protein
MGSAYTPGLTVSGRTVIEKTRRLPLKGAVLVQEGELVVPTTVIARTELPGLMQTVKLAEQLGVEPNELKSALRVSTGDIIEKGQLLAQTKGLFGFFKSEFKSPVAGKLEMVSEQTGHLGIRMPPTPIEKDAYVSGVVQSVVPEEGAVIRCVGALVQGIFGVGGERQGVIRAVTSSQDATLDESAITPECKGKILIGGQCVTLAALRAAAACGAAGIVVGGVVDSDLMEFMRSELKDPGFDIGVAITGHEPIPLTLVVTEGFGPIRMADRTYSLLQSLNGRAAAINGATQIRAGVIRPEVIVADADQAAAVAPPAADAGELRIGTPIRVIREPYFGALGSVTGLPSELTQVDSETWVRVLNAALQDGRKVTVPRANVEIIVT